MTAAWLTATAAAALVLLTELWALAKQRRLLLGDPQRRHFFVEQALAPNADARHPSPAAVAVTGSTPSAFETQAAGVVYVDSQGHCTFVDHAARELLHWSGGDLSLHDILPGGAQQSAELMDTVARLGNVEPRPTLLAGSVPCQVSAVAMRDRNDNFWGAAVFLQRSAPAAATGIRAVRSRR